MRNPPPQGSAAHILKAFDVVSLSTFGILSVLVWQGVEDLVPADLRVYHLAAGHTWSDDVFLHTYPDWAFTYPPSALILLAVLGLPLAVARLFWFVVSVGAVWTTAWVTVRACAPGGAWLRPGAISAVASATLLSWPVLWGLALGQAAPFIMGLSAVGILSQSGRWSGVLVGTAASIKLTPALFALHWLFIGRRREAALAAATFVAWSAAAALLMPRSSWWYYGEAGLLRAEQDYSEASNQALTGFAARIGLDSAADRGIVGAISGVLLLLALVVARRLHRRGWPAVAVLLVGVWSGIAAPLAWTHAFGWWVPLAFAIALTGRRISDWAVSVVIILIPYFQLLGPSLDDGVDGPIEYARSGSYAMLALAVTVWLWWRASSSKTGDSRDEPASTPASEACADTHRGPSGGDRRAGPAEPARRQHSRGPGA